MPRVATHHGAAEHDLLCNIWYTFRWSGTCSYERQERPRVRPDRVKRTGGYGDLPGGVAGQRAEPRSAWRGRRPGGGPDFGRPRPVRDRIARGLPGWLAGA